MNWEINNPETFFFTPFFENFKLKILSGILTGLGLEFRILCKLSGENWIQFFQAFSLSPKKRNHQNHNPRKFRTEAHQL